MQLTGPGVMGPPRDRDQAIRVIREAVELGVTHIDTADAYGPHVANELVTAISPNIRVGESWLRTVFLDPAEAALCPDSEKAQGGMVAAFHQSAGADVGDPRVVQIVGELSVASEAFRRAVGPARRPPLGRRDDLLLASLAAPTPASSATPAEAPTLEASDA
ncbi:aldo/keto reductase [Cellulomonas chengniuliangii]|uniref:Aldo/keto reductase n=1 Tax=Cellulomonas chengniuliangii TaxID=2968084 RepID=A0ABY5L585_9CELL|nr:aldo/keto reductase [Cellulomonas chengniuliangii]MCC2308363.1 aldo/keto reductase [Cellulomonas chengniuliangii]UUI76944.1 aldo/keto reductase [Cellulomonas chengniuliangii]